MEPCADVAILRRHLGDFGEDRDFFSLRSRA
jgi:hypothetical protein